MKKEEYLEQLGHNAKAELSAIIERVNSLIADRKEINENIKIVFTEAEINGFDKKTIKEVMKLQNLEKEELEAQENLRDAYLLALGLI